MAIYMLRGTCPLGIIFNEDISIMKGGRRGFEVKRRGNSLFWIMFQVIDG